MASSSSSSSFSRFFACYLLTSLDPKYKSHTYIGFTVNPRRRLRQHNGEITQGAWRTKRKRPWEMVLVVHGFPTQTAALQFEWAWQNPNQSRHLRSEVTGKPISVAGKGWSLRTKMKAMHELLAANPFCRYPLNVHFLESPRRVENQRVNLKYCRPPHPPPHVRFVHGPMDDIDKLVAAGSKKGVNIDDIGDDDDEAEENGSESDSDGTMSSSSSASEGEQQEKSHRQSSSRCAVCHMRLEKDSERFVRCKDVCASPDDDDPIPASQPAPGTASSFSAPLIPSACKMHAHLTCLAGHFLKREEEEVSLSQMQQQEPSLSQNAKPESALLPMAGPCPWCSKRLPWSDLAHACKKREHKAAKIAQRYEKLLMQSSIPSSVPGSPSASASQKEGAKKTRKPRKTNAKSAPASAANSSDESGATQKQKKKGQKKTLFSAEVEEAFDLIASGSQVGQGKQGAAATKKSSDKRPIATAFSQQLSSQQIAELGPGQQVSPKSKKPKTAAAKLKSPLKSFPSEVSNFDYVCDVDNDDDDVQLYSNPPVITQSSQFIDDDDSDTIMDLTQMDDNYNVPLSERLANRK